MSDQSTALEQTSRCVAILGADALLVALPSTPTQLANACFAGGFDEVFPATWGDELIAAGCLEELEGRTGPAIFCACPLVAEQLRGAAELRRFIVPFVSPPVAVARYLRSLHPGDALRITYVGDCPGADDPAIDIRLSPHELLSTLSKRGILPATQRPDLGKHAAHDRRRFYSLPGGVPSPQWLGGQWPKRTLVDVHAGDALAGLANQTLSRGHTLIDFAPHLGCACAGAVNGNDAQDARKAVVALEPPRAQSEVVIAAQRIEVSLPGTAEHHATDVTWGDFLAALPAALAMHPEDSSAPPTTRQSSRTAPRRAAQRKAALPRAYMAARVGVRRERPAKPRKESTQPIAPLQHARRDSAASETPVIAVAERTGAPLGRREEISLTRPNPWIARRASQEGLTGPRGTSPQRAGLATADRWLLAGLMLGGSVLIAVLTSALTMRGMRRADALPPAIATSVAASAPAAAAVSPAPAAVGRDTALTIRATRALDTSLAVAAPRADSATPNHEEDRGTVAPAPAATRLSPMPEVVAQVPKRAPVRVEHRPVVARARATPRVSSPPPRSLATSAGASAPPAITPVVTSPPASVPIIAAPASSIAQPAVNTADPAPATSTANAQVLEELRAIHAEINARKRHVDSLAAALDSLKRVPTPN